MKKVWVFLIAAASIICLLSAKAYAGDMDVLVNKLVEKGVLSPSEAQIVIDDTKLRVSKDLAEQKSYSVPDWTQRIKWGGDVRFRTQGDWGKNNTRNVGNDGLQNQRIRNRIRGRFYMDAKVNDFTYASVRFAGGGENVRSTNDTTDNYWSKKFTMFDWYYMRFEAPAAVHRDFGQYFSDAKLWAGKFPIPFEYSELVWDSDTNPSGVAFQYVSPDLGNTGMIPLFNIFSNTAMLWLNESQNYTNDPMLWGWQVGVKTDQFGPLASIANISTAIYNFASAQGRLPTGTAGTNTRTLGLGQDGVGATADQGYRYGFCVFDLLASIDNQKVFGFDFPHGLYADYIHNMECAVDGLNNGYMLGGYIGKKKIKEPGDWKARAEMRYIERDAVPDFMPDSDFYGFGNNYTANNTAGNTSAQDAGGNGFPVEGGTNGKGINLAFEYQLFKNTSLNLEYYWMKPIKSSGRTAPWNELQVDVVTKF